MNGVIMPFASAGSNHVGASEMCTAQVSWPSGAAAPGDAEKGTIAADAATNRARSVATTRTEPIMAMLPEKRTRSSARLLCAPMGRDRALEDEWRWRCVRLR